jgi:hypothetical protein
VELKPCFATNLAQEPDALAHIGAMLQQQAQQVLVAAKFIKVLNQSSIKRPLVSMVDRDTILSVH